MNDLITITANKVDGRELHEFLQIETPFKKWIDRIIVDYDFVEDMDFWTKMSETSIQGGRPATEYELTLDMAKQICMIQRTDLGKQARQYFIACEKQAKEKQKLLTPAEMLLQQSQLLVQQERRQKALEIEQAKQKQKLDDTNSRLDLVTTRLNNLSGIDIKGTPRQVLNKMIQAYAYQQGKTIGKAWSDFYSAFHIAFGIRIKIRWANYVNKNGLTKKKYKILDYLEEHNYINDAINVVDKMLNK